MILLVCKSRKCETCKLRDSQIASSTIYQKLHNTSHFSLLARLGRLARLALKFSRKACLILHNSREKNCKTRLAVNPTWQSSVITEGAIGGNLAEISDQSGNQLGPLTGQCIAWGTLYRYHASLPSFRNRESYGAAQWISSYRCGRFFSNVHYDYVFFSHILILQDKKPDSRRHRHIWRGGRCRHPDSCQVNLPTNVVRCCYSDSCQVNLPT